MKKLLTKRNVYLFLIVLWICFIWGHSLQVAEESNQTSGRWLVLINSLLENVGFEIFSMNFIRKAAHFVEFLVLGVLGALEYSTFPNGKAASICAPFLGCLLVAQIDETIQLFVEGRAGMVLDVWLDFSGSICGIVLILLVFHITSLSSSSRKGNNLS